MVVEKKIIARVMVVRVFFGALQDPGLATGSACNSCSSLKIGLSLHHKHDNPIAELSLPSWPVPPSRHEIEPARVSPGLLLIHPVQVKNGRNSLSHFLGRFIMFSLDDLTHIYVPVGYEYPRKVFDNTVR